MSDNKISNYFDNRKYSKLDFDCYTNNNFKFWLCDTEQEDNFTFINVTNMAGNPIYTHNSLESFIECEKNYTRS